MNRLSPSPNERPSVSKHVFLMNVCHDAEQASRTVELLNRHFNQSDIFVYYDGPKNGNVEGFANKTYEEYEPHKPKGLTQAIRVLLYGVLGTQYYSASFIHADMIPTDKEQFYRFIARFERTGKWLTYAPMLPGHGCLDYCNLHFNLFTLPLFMVSGIKYEKPDDPGLDYNEYILTKCFDKAHTNWIDRVYHTWSMNWPITQTVTPMAKEGVIEAGDVRQAVKLGHCRDNAFVYHNYMPESSIIHTNDPSFWKHTEDFCRW